MKIIIVLAMLFFAIPLAWYTVRLFVMMWTEMFEKILDGARYISYYLPAIHLNHSGPGGNQLIWDSASKTMYGHPDGVSEIEEE